MILILASFPAVTSGVYVAAALLTLNHLTALSVSATVCAVGLHASGPQVSLGESIILCLRQHQPRAAQRSDFAPISH